jgi:hypothetical protein
MAALLLDGQCSQVEEIFSRLILGELKVRPNWLGIIARGLSNASTS